MTALLGGCVKTNCRCLKGSDLPNIPIAGEQVADELEIVCKDKKCMHLNNWLNELYLFKKEYAVYQAQE